MTTRPPLSSQDIFRKRHASCEAPTRRDSERPSKLTPSAIFPSPDNVPREFDIANTEELQRRIPLFWKKHAPRVEDTGEILLTKEQVEQLADMLIKERIDVLRVKYTEIMANVTEARERALRCAKASREDPVAK